MQSADQFLAMTGLLTTQDGIALFQPTPPSLTQNDK